MMGDLYEVLEIPKDADLKTIRKAFHREALKHHPDKRPDVGGGDEHFLRIVEAFTVLSNESLKASYDKQLRIQEEALRANSSVSSRKKAMIERLELCESQTGRQDPFEMYRQDLKSALRDAKGGTEGKTFDEYEHIILSALMNPL